MNLKTTFGAAILYCLMLASCRKDEPAKPVRQNKQAERPSRTVDEKKDDKKKDIDGGSLRFYIDKEEGLSVIHSGKDGVRIKINGSDGHPGQRGFQWKFNDIPEILELTSVNDAGRSFKCRVPINEVAIGLYTRELEVSGSKDVSFELPPFLHSSSNNGRTSIIYNVKPGAALGTLHSYDAVRDSRIVFAANHIKQYRTSGYLDAVLLTPFFYYTANANDADGNFKINFSVECREGVRLKVIG